MSASHLCPVCNLGFREKRSLSDHAVEHWGCKYLFCAECGSSFKHRSKMIRHLLSHSGIKLHKCPLCEARFNNPSSLKKHGLVHGESKPYKCETCGSAFRDSSNYRKHVLGHRGVEYGCGLCDKRYKRRWHLRVHEKTHTNDAAWACFRCPKVFYTKKDKIRHELTHSDVKNFKCHICDANFRRKDNLERHFRNAHPDREPTSGRMADVDGAATLSTSNSKKDAEPQKKENYPKLTVRNLNNDDSLLRPDKIHKEISPTADRIFNNENRATDVTTVEPKTKISSNEKTLTKSDEETRLKILEANNKRESVIFMSSSIEKGNENKKSKNCTSESRMPIVNDESFHNNYEMQYSDANLIDHNKRQYHRNLYDVDHSSCTRNSLTDADANFYNQSIIQNVAENPDKFPNKLSHDANDKNQDQEMSDDISDDYSPLSPTYSQFDDEKARWRITQLASQSDQMERSEPINYSPESIELYKKILLVPFKSSSKKQPNSNAGSIKLNSSYKSVLTEDKLRNNDTGDQNCAFSNQTRTEFASPVQKSLMSNSNFSNNTNHFLNSNYSYIPNKYWKTHNS